jgi:hypothetical protein
VALAPEDASVLALAGRACNSLGDRPGALRWIGEAVRRGYGVESLVRNPALAWLEGDPRFRRMIETRSVEQAGFLQSNDHPGGRT